MKNIRSGSTFFLFTLMFSLHEMKIFWYSLKKSKFSFYFIFTRQCAFLTSYLTSPKKKKQNMNVMAPRDKTACQTFPCKCKICISSIESDVYNKKKIQMFVVNMTFISSREVKKMYISFVPSALMKYTFFHFTRWNKSHIHSKHLNILYILLLLVNPCYISLSSLSKPEYTLAY